MTPLLAPGLRPDRSFERLYRRHVGDVYRYALAVLRNPADAEDVTQTTFLNAYRAFQRGERPIRPHNWLIAIAHNVCRMRWRQAGHRPREVALEAVGSAEARSHARGWRQPERAGAHLVEVRGDDDLVIPALRMLYERAKLAAEPSAAAGLGALLSGAVDVGDATRVACVISGGNIDLGRLAALVAS